MLLTIFLQKPEHFQPKLEKSGCIFIDRSPKHFELILNLMRDGNLWLPETEKELRELCAEANYYQMFGLYNKCGVKLSTIINFRMIQNQKPITKNNSYTRFFVFSLIFLVFVYYIPALKSYFIVEKSSKCYLF
ncbi:Potassium channel tetramerization-type BTB domain-containing protein [Caenorhabditis elegans]|uniref:Potassium channel tetramerisation-type BTB domain-containing protein n=1 Tax=Caenorhabditis elegans TaxID=6239 RepID=Q65ZG7_CAEEL|nr:Potassium channel tetramerization-type BTB domain-containing protein [Caenorhabditis elegans]CCD64940.1 Potassium channel tetramerisation-type BTB domain-containing protein [Caenorhabditis elegans]|eukprot:NP_494483.2 Uncharacterized protein CELE_ZC239.17 [Caenorhabditis elegans]